MSDDLIKRLRVANSYSNPNFVNPFVEPIKAEAADCIEELERDQEQGAKDYCALMEKHDALHVKLAKAVEIGNNMASFIRSHYIPSVAAEWEDMLAELEGKE